MTQLISRPGSSKQSDEMEIILQPNNWTCNPSAYAMCMGITLDQVLATLGHDGSRIIDIEGTVLTKVVECFDSSELVLAAYRLGFSAIEFPILLGTNIKDVKLNPHWPTNIWNEFPKDQRFVVILESDKYRGSYHCVAWQRDRPYYLDPHFGKVDMPFQQPPVYAIAITRINNGTE